MIRSEYVRNLNRNFERIGLENEADCKRYQYCILFRGGIKYLLSCSCKQIDGCSYLYYDISSSQNIKQLFGEKSISRGWMKEFLWSIRRLRQELNRFLLDDRNILWSPEHIYQDLEKNDFRFLYIPYCVESRETEDTFEKLLEFWVDRVDYEDAPLVEFVYHVYEQFAAVGACYLEKQIFEDFNKIPEQSMAAEIKEDQNDAKAEGQEKVGRQIERSPENTMIQTDIEKRGIRALFGRNWRKQDDRDGYREELRQEIAGYVVCEETADGERTIVKDVLAEEFGKTIYIEEKEGAVPGLYTEKGELVTLLDKFPFLIGKRKEDVDYALADYSASRVHARFAEEKDGIYLEDLNSTNGTFKNGLRMQPYEKRKLESEDTLRFGKSVFIYR